MVLSSLLTLSQILRLLIHLCLIVPRAGLLRTCFCSLFFLFTFIPGFLLHSCHCVPLMRFQAMHLKMSLCKWFEDTVQPGRWCASAHLLLNSFFSFSALARWPETESQHTENMIGFWFALFSRLWLKVKGSLGLWSYQTLDCSLQSTNTLAQPSAVPPSQQTSPRQGNQKAFSGLNPHCYPQEELHVPRFSSYTQHRSWSEFR